MSRAPPTWSSSPPSRYMWPQATTLLVSVAAGQPVPHSTALGGLVPLVLGNATCMGQGVRGEAVGGGGVWESHEAATMLVLCIAFFWLQCVRIRVAGAQIRLHACRGGVSWGQPSLGGPGSACRCLGYRLQDILD